MTESEAGRELERTRQPNKDVWQEEDTVFHTQVARKLVRYRRTIVSVPVFSAVYESN